MKVILSFNTWLIVIIGEKKIRTRRKAENWEIEEKKRRKERKLKIKLGISLFCVP